MVEENTSLLLDTSYVKNPDELIDQIQEVTSSTRPFVSILIGASRKKDKRWLAYKLAFLMKEGEIDLDSYSRWRLKKLTMDERRSKRLSRRLAKIALDLDEEEASAPVEPVEEEWSSAGGLNMPWEEAQAAGIW